jgi:DNA ligase (NAD+)
MNIDIQSLSNQTQSLLASSQSSDFFQEASNYNDLIDCIIDHNHLYYIENSPIISDKDYDTLFQLLKEFESLRPEYIRDYSPTQKIVWQYEIQTEFKKSNHQTAILSLQNTYNSEDITERYGSIITMLTKKIEDIEDNAKKEELTTKFQNLEFTIEPKYDGLSIVLTYHDGKLYKAVTRGDGYTWDDVTENIKTINNLPHIIPEKNTIILRGEVLMPTSIRKKINQEREDNGEEPFANTRNAAAWSVKLLDTNEVAKRWLACYIYDALQWQETNLQYFSQYISPVLPPHNSLQDIIDIINNPNTKDTLLKADIDFDGLVIKVIDPEIRELLGSTNHHPRRAIAYKFPAQQIATQIESIDRQVWRTGILTPVANLTPTELSGVTISRVSLHNRDFITTKDIQLHDRVWLQRSGEVIPYIVGVITNRRANTQKIQPDDIHCPACITKTQKIENTVGTKTKPEITTQFICPNHDCPGILKEKLKHFVSKNCMNISSVGEAIIDMLVDQQILNSLSDIYTLTSPEKIFVLKRLPGIAEKKIDTFIDEINKSKNNSFRRLLNGLWISGIGIKLAKEISSQLEKCGRNDIKNIEEAFSIITNQEFISSIFGIGDKLIEELNNRYTDSDNKKLLKEFQKYGLKFHTPISKVWATNTKTICITWTFPLSRSELEFYITQAGYTFSPNLTKSVDYLLVGEHAGSKKDKIWPNTKIIDNREEIYSLLNISVPLFEDPNQTKNTTNNNQMQSLFW